MDIKLKDIDSAKYDVTIDLPVWISSLYYDVPTDSDDNTFIIQNLHVGTLIKRAKDIAELMTEAVKKNADIAAMSAALPCNFVFAVNKENTYRQRYFIEDRKVVFEVAKDDMTDGEFDCVMVKAPVTRDDVVASFYISLSNIIQLAEEKLNS